MIGQRIGHYEIVSRLGAGGMGEVFLARDSRLGREIALKVLPPSMANDPERRARFEREAQSVAALRHPGIVTIHAIEEMDGFHFLAMELIDGAPLSSFIQESGMEVGRFLDLAVQLSDAVGAAHARGITHRDLKPANVMIETTGRVKVLDFGLAKSAGVIRSPESRDHAGEPSEGIVDRAPGWEETSAATGLAGSITVEGSILGTVHYMSPEQAEGKVVGPASDVFSLGILFYEMATGEKPFQGETSLSVLSSILKEEPQRLTGRNTALPQELERIVGRCLAKDPSDRYVDANGLRDELSALRASVDSGGLSRTQDGQGAAQVSAATSRPVDAGGAGRPSEGPSGRSWWWQLLAAVVVVGVSMVLLPILFQKDEGGVSPAAIGASGRPSVAVFQFRNHSGDEEIRWLATGVPSMLLTGLAQTPGLDVVSSARVEEILQKIGRETAEEIDQSILSEVARRSGAGAVVRGNIFKSGEVIRIDVQVEDVATGRLLFAREASGAEVFPIVDALTVAIRDGLKVDPETLVERPLAEMASSSLEAYRYYDEGARAVLVHRFADASRALKAALALDPDFAMAHFLLARTYASQAEFATAVKHLERAWNLRDRLPARDRGLVEADYLANVMKDRDGAVQVLERLVAQFPDEVNAYLMLSSATMIEEPAARLEILRRGVEAVPNAGALYNEYAYHLRGVGQYEEALRQLDRYEQLEPEEVNPRDSMAEIYLTIGRPEEAYQKFGEAIQMDPSFASAWRGRALALAMMGRYPEAFEEYDRSIAAVESSGLSALGLRAPKAMLLLKAGRYEESARWAVLDDAESTTDAGTSDTGTSDTGTSDTGTSDTGTSDTGAARQAGYASAMVAMYRSMRASEYAACVREARRVRARLPEGIPEVFGRAVRMVSLYTEGTALARSLDLDGARVVAEELAALGPHPLVPWAADWLAGEIALSAGNLDDAERLFRSGVSDLDVTFTNNQQGLLGGLVLNDPASRDWEARLRVARHDLHGAVDVYRDLNRPDPGAAFVSLFEPLYVLEIARLLDRMGDREAAAAEYGRFLKLWEHADPDRPELAEARTYLASTTG